MKNNQMRIFSALLLSMFISACAGESYVNLKEKVRHDDFFYSVTDVTKSPVISDGTETIKPDGVFYIVHLKIENEAKRVAHSWDNSIAYIEDGSGKEYENNTVAQMLYCKANGLTYKEEYELKAGSSAVTVFIFDVPAGVKDACLKFRGGFLMGDLFDGGKFTKTKVKLY